MKMSYCGVLNIIFLGLIVIYVNSAPLQYTGVNEAGADFGVGVDGSGAIPGNYGSDYIYPSTFSISHLASKGMNIFRVPFRWERLQPTLNTAFDSTELSRLTSTINYITSLGAYALLDPHNYARYRGNVIGSGVSNAQFQDFWNRLATVFASNNLVIFGLMNEPENMATEAWLAGANAGIAGIRSAGATQLILVPGNGFTGAHSWYSSWYGSPNAQVMLNIVDPQNNYAYEVHQYLDGDYSGSNPACQSTTIGSTALQAFTTWLNANNKKGFLGEFGGGNNPTCQAAIDNMLTYMETNSNVWLGWTWWAAGPLWGNYFLTLEPNSDGTDQPQLAWLIPHLRSVGTYIPISASASASYRPPGQSSVVYADSVVSPWSSVNTWASSYSFSNPSPVYAGSSSIRFKPTNYDGLYFTCGTNTCFDSSNYAISMYVNPGSTNAAIRVTLYRNNAALNPVVLTANPNQWNYLVFLISSFNNPGPFSGFTIQLDTGTGSDIYIDNIDLLISAPATTASNSPSRSYSSSFSPSRSVAPSSASSVSASTSYSNSISKSRPASITSSISLTVSVTPTISLTRSNLASISSSISTTRSLSKSASISLSISVTRSITPSKSIPASTTRSASVSPSKSPPASSTPAVSTSPTAQNQLAVYTEGLQGTWILTWSWNANYALTNTVPTRSGSYSLAWTNPVYGSGLYFACNNGGTSCFSASFVSLSGWLHGGTTGGQVLEVQLRRSGSPVGNVIPLTATANTWVQFTISINTQFAPGAGDLMGFSISGTTGSGTVYLDDIVLN